MHKQNQKKSIAIMLLIAYAIIMMWLMFLLRAQAPAPRFSPKLFQSTKSFLWMYKYGDIWAKLTCIANIAGNFIMFIPIGLLFPHIWKSQNKYPIFVITVIIVISVLEATQYFTRLGAADIDDLLFNTIGASIGFIITKIHKTYHE